jgi:Uma2 family endonuclease
MCSPSTANILSAARPKRKQPATPESKGILGYKNRVIAENRTNPAASQNELNRLATAVHSRYSGSALMATEISKRLFTVHDYHRMVDAGILSEDDRVELIHGEILAMIPIGPPHNGAIIRATQALVRIVGDRALVEVQGSVRLDEYDEPQPDIVLLRPKDDFYSSRHAGPSDIFLIIEMADSSLEYDRTIKARLYAETGVPEYWIADVGNERLFAYSDIHESTYRAIRQFQRGETVAPQLLPECRIPIDALLP